MKTILSLLLFGALSSSAQFQLISRVQLVPLSNWVGVISTNFTALSNNFVTVSNGVNSRQWGSLNLTNWGLFDTSVIASVAQQTLINSNLNWIGRTNGVGQKPTFYHQISLTNDAGDGGNTVFAIRHTDPSASFAQSWYYASGTKQWQIAADTNVFQFNHGGGSDPMVSFFQNGNISIGRAGGSVTNIGIWRGQSNVFMSLLGTNSAPVSLLGRKSDGEIVETSDGNSAKWRSIDYTDFVTNTVYTVGDRRETIEANFILHCEASAGAYAAIELWRDENDGAGYKQQQFFIGPALDSTGTVYSSSDIRIPVAVSLQPGSTFYFNGITSGATSTADILAGFAKRIVW